MSISRRPDRGGRRVSVLLPSSRRPRQINGFLPLAQATSNAFQNDVSKKIDLQHVGGLVVVGAGWRGAAARVLLSAAPGVEEVAKAERRAHNFNFFITVDDVFRELCGGGELGNYTNPMQ